MPHPDFLLHPVRMRVIQLLLGTPELTTAQIREQLPDIPIATLYRHIAELVAAELLVTVREQKVRGATEKTYQLTPELTGLDAQAVAAMSPADLQAAFGLFSAGLSADLKRYLAQENLNPLEDGLTFAQVTLRATPEQFQQLLSDWTAALDTLRQQQPAPGQQTRTIATVAIPLTEPNP